MEQAASLTRRIETLTSEQIAEVARFVDSLERGNTAGPLLIASTQLSEAAFAAVWTNVQDDAYDAL